MEHKIHKGYCHLYYGDGKGKTSILNGMTLRALGVGFKIKYYRFMKNWPSGELDSFKKLGIPIADYYFSSTKFFWEMNEIEQKKVQAEAKAGCDDLLQDAKSGSYDMIFIDELFSCLDNKIVTEQDIINIIKNKHANTELVFSAHEVDNSMMQYFDLISRVVKVKHYYDTIKLLARKGIEF